MSHDTYASWHVCFHYLPFHNNKQHLKYIYIYNSHIIPIWFQSNPHPLSPFITIYHHAPLKFSQKKSVNEFRGENVYALLRRPDQWSGGRRGVNTQEVPKRVSEASGGVEIYGSMDWFRGKFAGNHGISLWNILKFFMVSCRFSLRPIHWSTDKYG